MSATRIGLRKDLLLTASLILAGFSAALVLNLPGHLSYDSVMQLLQGRTGIYNTWHPPVMAWLLGLLDAIVPGTALFVLFDAILIFGAFLSVLVFAPEKRIWPAAGVAAVVILSPQLMLYQGIVWKDVIFADAGVAGFVGLAHVARVWPNVRLRVGLIVLDFLLLSLAALTRQNGLLVLPCGAAALGWIGWQKSASVRRGLAYGLSALALASLLVFAATKFFTAHSDGEPGPSEQLALLQVYDLAGAIANRPDLPLASFSDHAPDMEKAVRTEGSRLFSPIRNDPIAESPVIEAAMRNAPDGVIAEQWLGLVTRHPLLYLKTRAVIFWQLFWEANNGDNRAVFTGIDGPADEMHQLGIAPRKSQTDRALDRYSKWFEHTPMLSHLTFLAITIAALIMLLRRRRPEDLAFAQMLASALLFTASFFVISISCDYRYLYFLDLAALTALFYLALDVESVLEPRPRRIEKVFER